MQLHAGWVGTLRLTVRSGVQSTSTLPGADGAPSRVKGPLPGGVLGADGPQVVAVTADTAMRAASADNVAPLVSGIDRAEDGRWQTVLYGQGGRQAAAADVVESSDSPGPYHAVEPALLPDLKAWPWVLAGAALAGVLLPPFCCYAVPGGAGSRHEPEGMRTGAAPPRAAARQDLCTFGTRRWPRGPGR